MIVDLKINTDTLVVLHNLLQMIYELPYTTSRNENIYRSIGKDLAEKFEKKHKAKVKKVDLFDAKKMLKISLKYHEVWALHEVLVNLVQFVNRDYESALVHTQISFLNQKLA